MRLQIVVKGGCIGSEEAYRLTDYIRREFPAVEVEVIEWGGPQPVPDAVFATPTYLLDGVIIFLGNPSPTALVAAMNARCSVA